MNKREIICYETDASRLIGKAKKVVFPKTVQEVQNAINTSEEIVIRGGGTGLMGGCIPENSVVIDLSKMNKIIGFNKEYRVIIVEAGITIKELNEKLNSIGFEFPIDSFNPASTIGGMIAINSPGFRSMKYGRIKDWIEEIEFINGRGESMKTSKTDLGDICGLEGTTGVIVKVKLKVNLKKKRSVSVFQTESLEEILLMAKRLRLEKDIIMLEFFSKKVSGILGLKEKYNLIIEFDSDRGKIKGKEYEKVIILRKKAYNLLLKRGYYNNQDPKFFLDKLDEFFFYLEDNQIPYLGYLGAGIIHAFFKDEESDKDREAVKLIKKMGGKIGRYGVGIKRKDFLDDFEKKIIQRIKLRHDPFGKLNRGRVIDFEAKLRSGRHLRLLEKGDIDEIKPFLGEEKTADEILEGLTKEEIEENKEFEEDNKFRERLGQKTPEQKIEEFIEEINKETKSEITKEATLPKNEIEEKIKDYEQTFDSELSNDRKEKIEEFAKNISRNIVSRERETEKRGKVSKEEQELINKVMMGGINMEEVNKTSENNPPEKENGGQKK